MTFNCGDCTLTWEGRSWGRRAPWSPENEIAFSGEKGTLTIHGGRSQIFDPTGKEIDKGQGRAGNLDHLSNFVESIRDQAKPHAEIAEGAKSTMFCHLANIAHRTGHTIDYDEKYQQIVDDSEARKPWDRDYELGWKPAF